MIIPDEKDLDFGRRYVMDKFLEECFERNLSRDEVKRLLRYSLADYMDKSQVWASNYDEYADNEVVRLVVDEYLFTIPRDEFQVFVNRLDTGLRRLDIGSKASSEVNRHAF